MVFELQITDLYGNVLTWTDEFGTTQDTIRQFTSVLIGMGVSEERTAKATLSLYHPAVQHLTMVNESGQVVAALGRMLRIKYRDTTLFWGIIVQPKFSTENATAELNCQGPTYKLRHRNLNFSDSIVGTEESPEHNPSDWTTVKAIVDAAKDTASQYAENIPDIGVDVVNVDAVAAPDGFWTDIQRGDKNWDKIEEVCQSISGPEFDVVPYDPPPDELPFDTTLVPV